MKDNTISFDHVNKKIALIMNRRCMDSSEVVVTKRHIHELYTQMAYAFHDHMFFNFGVWNEKLHQEYIGLNFDFSKLYDGQDVYSQLLLYYLIRPLVKEQFFNKKILDIGCGTGIGLKASSQLLKTKYALGIDLVMKNVTNANKNFHQENKINYIKSDAEHLPVENESFDIITNLESSHLYPRLEQFFSEVERVLSPGGFFCYSDLYTTCQNQSERLNKFVNANSNLKIIAQHNITSMVQASIYQRLIIKESVISAYAAQMLGDKLKEELPALIYLCGLAFLPWWKIRLKNPELRELVKLARKISFWSNKNYFYYLIQKIA